MSAKHVIAVTGVIEFGGRFLFTKRPANASNFPGKWVFPGGKVEAGEDVVQALLRELSEETGAELDGRVAFLSAYHFHRKESDGTRFSTQGLVFLAHAKSDKIKPNAEITEYRWISPEEIAGFGDDTIYGMEAHVRNAVIALKKNSAIDWRAASVSAYQSAGCSMDSEYFGRLMKSGNPDSFLSSGENLLPKRKG